MKKIYLGLAIVGILSGCAASKPAAPKDNLIMDPHFSELRADDGKSKYWRKSDGKNKGLGQAGTSKSTAFGDEGSIRIRFISKNDDFTVEPGVTQLVKGLVPNTDYTFSLYYQDKRGNDSVAQLLYGVIDGSGKSLADNSIHVSDVRYNPRGNVDSGFRQTYVSFNSGANASVTVYAKLHINDPSKIDLKGDIPKQTEVRIDEFKLKKDVADVIVEPKI